MKALEFHSVLETDGSLRVPREIATQIHSKEAVRVIVLVDEPLDAEDRAWANFTAEQFLKGYADSDAVYDQLSTG